MRSIFGPLWELKPRLPALLRGQLPKVPKYEELLIGDVILTKGDPKKDVTGSQIKLGKSDAASQWTHAMLYVGNLHVLESVPPLTSSQHVGLLHKIRGGVTVSPLTLKNGQSSTAIVLRHIDLHQLELRHAVGRRALLDARLWPEAYGVRSVLNTWLSLARWRRNLISSFNPKWAFDPNLKRAATCSEYVLKIYWQVAGFLVEDAMKLKGTSFFPADLFDHVEFSQKPLEFYDIDITNLQGS